MSRPVLITRESPEPDRTKAYKDAQGCTWAWDANHTSGPGWSFNAGSWLWVELTHPDVDVADFPWRPL